MVKLQPPPGLTSIETVSSGTSAVGPPNQSAKRSGSVHSCQTRSRGASMTRVIVIPGSATPQTPLEVIEALFPQRFEPVRRLLERPAAKPRRSQLRGPASFDQPGVFEHAEVL